MKRSSRKEMFKINLQNDLQQGDANVLQKSLRLALKGYTAFLQQASFSAIHTT